MVMIDVLYPSSEQPVREELAPGEALLLGRAPDPSRVDAELVAGLRVRVASVPSPAVSSNHLLCWYDGERVLVRDLGSRNKSWLQLPGHEVVETRASAALCVELSPVARRRRASRPKDAEWSSPEEFPRAVVSEVSRWLRRVGASVRAELVRADEGEERPARPLTIPLEGGWALSLDEPVAGLTVDPSWGDAAQSLVEYVHEQNAAFRADRSVSHDGHLVLASPAIREVHRRVVEATERGLQVILLGETGSGKSTLARCYHLHSSRGAGPFESVNCAEIERQFAHTRLFGARKGAYTGCVSDVVGAVECARGGTLLLDELAELPADVQTTLLTFLDTRRYKRLGDDEWRAADVRIVCGTNADLRRAVREGRFREDLWYRLAGRTIEVPPLRERREDIIAHLQTASLGERRGAVTAWEALTADARELAVRGHDWRGNFRELDGFVRRLPPDARASSIDADACRQMLAEGALDRVERSARAASNDPWQELLRRASEAFELRTGQSAPSRASDFKDYVEEVLKPLFFASALDMEDLDAVPERPSPSFEELARRIGCDGATVKNQLARYVELRRAQRPSAKPGGPLR